MNSWFYRAFEDRYRGTRAVIRERQMVYLPFLKPLSDVGMSTALDLGCGRGEWLELLGESGFAAEGVDMDDAMLAACRERGLNVFNGDAFDVLRTRADDSVGVVSAFHLVEHISFEQVQVLIQEALRVLQPGGLLILETPNPENLVVGTSSFYDDPSHVRPLPPKLLAFAVEYGGFARHNVLRLQESEHLHGAGPVRLFDVLSGVSPDYSVVAQKGNAPVELAALDALFATSYGLDLHGLAQRYQQQLDEVHIELGQLRDYTASTGPAIQQQLAEVDRQIAHVHSTMQALAADLASQTDPTARLDQIEATMQALAADLASQTDPTARLDQIEATMRYVQLTTDMGMRQAAALRSRISELEDQRHATVSENGRLAQHVAWIENRLTQAEAEAAGLRHQLSELMRRRSGLTGLGLRTLGHGRRRLVGVARSPALRRPAHALLRRAVQEVLRRPALKRLARSVIARFPQLHTRLLRLMYAPTPVNAEVAIDTDPLASEMSPRSLRIYRAMLAASKQED